MRIILLATTMVTGREQGLQRLHTSLQRQSFRHFELLLGVQGDVSYSCPKDYSFLTTIVKLPLLSLSAARNTLFARIPDDPETIVALTDDDCWYDPEALANAARAFAADSGLAAMIADPNGKLKRKCLAGRYSLFFNSPSWVLFFRASVMRQTGLFDQQMGIGAHTPWQSGEETDYLLRVLKDHPNGISFADDVIVHHPDELAAPAKARAYAAGRMYLLHKHGLPSWFVLANIIHPVLALPHTAWRHGLSGIAYRWAIFTGRLRAWCQLGQSSK